MEFTQLLVSRESVRDYDPAKRVPEETLERILNAGRLAPSACNNQPMEFWLIESPEMLAKVRECYHRPWYKEAPHILVIVGYRNKAWVRSYDQYNSIETDLSIAMTHIILAAENEGVASCYIEAYDPAILKKALNLNENQVVFGITPLGYTHNGVGKRGNKQRKSLSEIVKRL